MVTSPLDLMISVMQEGIVARRFVQASEVMESHIDCSSPEDMEVSVRDNYVTSSPSHARVFYNILFGVV